MPPPPRRPALQLRCRARGAPAALTRKKTSLSYLQAAPGGAASSAGASAAEVAALVLDHCWRGAQATALCCCSSSAAVDAPSLARSRSCALCQGAGSPASVPEATPLLERGTLTPRPCPKPRLI